MRNLSILTASILTISAGAANAACPTNTATFAAASAALTATGATEACALSGVYDSARPAPTLTATNGGILWVLDGKVEIGNETDVLSEDAQSIVASVTADANASALNINAGVTIAGTGGGGSTDLLVIHRGSDINAVGTANNPIRMTSMEDLDGTGGQRAQWGGLYINGYASINNCGSVGTCVKYGEAGTGTYGGDNDTDSSGTLQYTTLAYAGFDFSAVSEFNGIAFQGVGSGTDVNHIQVHANQDDGVEFFGGTVNVKNLVLTSNRDDSFDVTGGWDGKAQYVLVYQDASLPHDRGFEVDGKGTFEPAAGKVANISIISNSSSNKDGGNSDGIKSRENNALTYANVAIQMTAGGHDCFDPDTETSTLLSAVGDCPNLGSAFSAGDAPAAYTATFNGYINGFNEAIQQPTSDALITGDTFFDSVEFIGAVRDCENDWTQGWVIPGTLPAVDQAQCVESVNVPIMGVAGMLALFAGFASIVRVSRKVK